MHKITLSNNFHDLTTLRQWRDNVTLALQRPGGARFEDVPEHIKALVRDHATLRQLVEALPHTDLCAVHQDLLDGGPGDCNCFKSRATLLSAAGKQMEVK